MTSRSETTAEGLEALIARRNDLRSQLAALAKTIGPIVQEAALKIMGLAVGDIIHSNGMKYRVIGVYPSFAEDYVLGEKHATTPWVIGNVVRKDGSSGVRRTIYRDWRKGA